VVGRDGIAQLAEVHARSVDHMERPPPSPTTGDPQPLTERIHKQNPTEIQFAVLGARANPHQQPPVVESDGDSPEAAKA
jgi:hypothetical protein